jgi:hypothetical protein
MPISTESALELMSRIEVLEDEKRDTAKTIQRLEKAIDSLRLSVRALSSGRDPNDFKPPMAHAQAAMRAVCNAYAVTEAQIRSMRRIRSLTGPRHAYCALCRADGIMTYQAIATELGDRNHSTISNALQAHNQLLESSEAYRLQWRLTLDEYRRLVPDSSIPDRLEVAIVKAEVSAQVPAVKGR